MRALLISLLLFCAAHAAPIEGDSELNSFDPDFGVYLGEFSNQADGSVSGKLYVVNDTALQLVNFTYTGKTPDVYFWLDKQDTPTQDGVKLPTFEFGIAPIGEYKNAARVVLLLPRLHKISEFESFSIYSPKAEQNYGTIIIPENVQVPKAQFLAGELKGSRYSVASGPILVVDRRTIKVFGFTFDGDKAPDGYFFVGKGANIVNDAGVKVPIRGRDTPDQIAAMNERYRGGQDLVIDLPEDYDVLDIDWLSIYCYKFRVDFGHVDIFNISTRIPPYVPPQKRFAELEIDANAWPVTRLLGNDQRRNFTFQLGLPGGKKGYQAMAGARPAKYVWYVNGYLAELYLKKGITYTFIVEGGDDKSTNDFYNPLYISDDQYGGYGKLSKEEKTQIQFFTGANPDQHVGRLCVWTSDDTVDATKFDSFISFRKSLTLKCETDKEPEVFEFTPTDDMPSTVYFQSYATYNMGYKIHLVDEMPTGVQDIIEEPYKYEEWSATQEQGTGPTSSAATAFSCLCLFFAAMVLNR
ncbi:unnamed protein product, partial [Mesorhabditis spiculigera]